MELKYKKADVNDVELLTQTRVHVLRAANKLNNSVDMSLVEKESCEYYKESLVNGTHTAYLVYDNKKLVATGGVSFFKVMPTFHNPSGRKAYIMNLYTDPEYRKKGIARETLDILVKESRENGLSFITLEATEMGKSLYKKYGFVEMKDEMWLPVT